MANFLVAFDIPAGVNKTRFYRELDRIAFELHFAKVGGSVYEFSGPDAAIRAHVLAELASQFGAGAVGEPNGPQVYALADEPPTEYFSHRELAKQIADALLVDHRVKKNKKTSRSIVVLAAELQGQTAFEWPDLAQFLKERVGAKEMTA